MLFKKCPHSPILCFLAFLFCFQLAQAAIRRDSFKNRCRLETGNNGTMLLEAARDRNMIFRLVGDDAVLQLNGIDVLAKLKQLHQYKAISQSPFTIHSNTEPLSLDGIKDQVRSVKRGLNRLFKRLMNMQNNTRRAGPNQWELRRDLQRVQRINSTLGALETSLTNDECQSNPCKNGGSCFSAYKDFQCDCTTGWQGKTCEDDVNECHDLAGTGVDVCTNNGQCINIPGSYRCVCQKGFSGTHCRLRQNVCIDSQSAEICSHGTCVSSNNAQGYVCICEQGWTWATPMNVSNTTANTGPCTRDVNECQPENNPCHDECINLPGSFRCGPCPVGYTGDGKFCRDIDECAVNNGGCSQRPQVTCINTEGSYRCGRCPLGWTGDGHTCAPVKSNLCNNEGICHPTAQCEYISDTVVCSCPVGSYGHGFGSEGCTSDASREPCAEHLCRNNGTCIAITGHSGTSCLCQPGYTGPLCEQNDACHPNPCENGGVCKLMPDNKYMCNCKSRYTGTTCNNRRIFCGTVLHSLSSELRYPPTGNVYQPNERCAFIIRTTPGQILNVTFNDFDLQKTDDCSADYLQLHDGSSLAARLIGRFCGKSLPMGNGNLLSTHNQLFFWFRSDDSNQTGGFNISWHSQPYACGDELTLSSSDSGIIRSPGYPGKASSNLNCQWHLTAPFGTRLVLRFFEITLNGGIDIANCSRDSLTIYDLDRKMLEACKSMQPVPLHSSSNKLTINFQTDTYLADSLFQLHYEVIAGIPNCGGIYTEPQGSISGYMDAAVCLYLIQQPQGTQIELNFQRVNFIKSEDCHLQIIKVYDGNSTDAPLLQQYCGDPTNLEPLLSSGNTVLLVYEYALQGLQLAKTFQLSYTRVCSANYSEALGGIIETPNYPITYLEHMTCVYNILGPINTIVHIKITDFSISETIPRMGEDNETPFYDETQTTYLDVHLSKNMKKRFYKSFINELLVAENNWARLIFHSANNPQNGRGLRVEYSFTKIPCGGVLYQNTGEISMQITADFCQWIIESPGIKQLSIRVFVVGSSFSLNIFDNSTKSEGFLLNGMSGDNNLYLMKEIYDLDVITIILHMSRRTSRYFANLLIQYEPEQNHTCGIDSSARFGVIKSPNWPKPYGALQDCIWIIRASLGQQIELIVQNFTLETTSDACTDDYLEIRNGDMALSPLIGRYCGQQIPRRIPSFGNRLFISYHSDKYIQDSGFYLTWQMTETGCGGKLYSQVGSIHSPHSMAGNSGAVSCDWQIVVSKGSTILLKLPRLGDDVCNGQLTIYDGPTVSSPILPLNCSIPGLVLRLYSSGNMVVVRYNADTMGIQFVLDYETNCQLQLNQLQGVIESPNFPENYPPNSNCAWDIRAGGRNNHIQIIFSHMDVERSSSISCEYDFVEITDMDNEEQLSRRHMCVIDGPITSQGNRLLVRFKSDSSAHGNGFHAEYKRIGCGAQLFGSSASFESPNAPFSVDVDCDWYIEAPAGKQISLIIYELYIEKLTQNCTEDSLTVSADRNATVTLLYICQPETTELRLISPGNTLYVHFQTNARRARKYFKARYTLVSAECGGLVSGSKGVIMSPGFQEGGSFYAVNMECVWTVEVPETYDINLRFLHFNLTDTANCQAAFLTLSKLDENGNENFLERACGSQYPLIRTVHGQRMKVHFRVSATSMGMFALQYERQCGGYLRSPFGYLRARTDENCNWEVILPKGARYSLSIYNLECTCPVGNNCTAGLKLFNADDDVLLNELCHDHPANIIVNADNVHIKASNINLYAFYSSVVSSCGGNITSARGTLTSPEYPASYPSNIECTWRLQVRPGNTIQLNFDTLDITQSTHCNEDYLELRTDRLLGLYCDNIVPTETLLVNSSIWIKFRTMPGNTGNGFKLRWSYLHNNELSSNNGTIEGPPTQAVKNDVQPFTWRILVERENVIMLMFEEYNTGLLLYDGFDENAMPVTIGVSPWKFISGSNVLYMQTNENFDAFKLKWHTSNNEALSSDPTVTSNNCSFTYKLGYNVRQVIQSPGYPKAYENDLNCTWIFKMADVTQHVYVELYDARLEVLNSCIADYLRISTSSNLDDWHEQLVICNSSAPSQLPIHTVHGTPYVKLNFVSDSGIQGIGFRAIARTACGSNITDTVGTILDSHIHRSIHPNATCTWYIEVRQGRRIDVNIEYSSQLATTACQIYGLIYDGIDAQAPLMKNGKFCNQVGFATRSFRTSRNHAYIKYKLPVLFANQKPTLWNLTYREFSECDGEIRLTHVANTYNISTPGYPYISHPYSECNWMVVAPAGETIMARFVDRFSMNTPHCDQEYFEILDGATAMSPTLLHSCVKPSVTIRSTSNIILVHYQANLAEPRSGFRLNVTVSSCGGEYHSFEGTLSSENYPTMGAYPKPMVCEYIIKLSAHFLIRLNFSDIHLPFNESNFSNTSDRIEVVDLANTERPIILTIYGNQSILPLIVPTESNEVIIRFVSVKMVNSYRGFLLQYDHVSGACSCIVNAPYGLLFIRPRDQLTSLMCYWHINVPKGQRVQLEFINLADIPKTILNNTRRSSTTFPYRRSKIQFSFYNDFTQTSRITSFNLNGYNDSGIIESTDNFMLVKISLDMLNLNGITLRARYNSNHSSLCPPEIGDQETGTLSSSALTSLGISSFHCLISFVAKDEETLTITVKELLLQGKLSTTAVTFTENFIEMKRLTSNATNLDISFTSITGQIQLRQNDDIKLLRFEVSYRRHACGGHIKLAEEITLHQPQLVDNSLSNGYGKLECAWRLETNYERGYNQISGNISLSDSCEREYLILYDGYRQYHTSPQHICGDTVIKNNTFQSLQQSTLVYHAASYQPGKSQFRIVVNKQNQGNNFMVGYTPSPPISINGEMYKNNMEINWFFSTVEGLSLAIQFEGRFFIEEADNCINDQLEVLAYKSDLWQTFAVLCGRKMPDKLLVPTHRIRIVFRTNSNITGDGFTFRVSAACEFSFQVTNVIQIISPPTVSSRAREVSCNYLFYNNATISKSEQQLIVRVNGSFPRSQNTCIAQVEAYKYDNGIESLIDSYCNDFEVSGYQRLRLHFDLFFRTRLRIQYQLQSCGGNYTTPFELRPMLGYSSDAYADNMHCIWHITAPPDHAVLINFKYFKMENDFSCRFDFVAIYKGGVINKEQRVGRMCGTLASNNSKTLVDSNQAVILVHSDSTRNKGGFLAHVSFTPNCNERVFLYQGNTEMSLYRHFALNISDDLLCYYRVMAPLGYRISIELKQIQLNTNNCIRRCNYLEIIDSMATKSNSMGKFYALRNNRTIFISSYEDVLIKLSADGIKARQLSFELNLKMERTFCGQTSFELSRNMSINIGIKADNNTGRNIHCMWQFKSKDDLELNFIWVRLQDVSLKTGKCIEYLYIGSYICGNSNNTSMVITQQEIVTIIFHSEELAESGGFDLIVLPYIACNRTYTELSGVIAFGQQAFENCTNEIHVPDGYSLTLSIMYIYFVLDNEGINYLKVMDIHKNRVIIETTSAYTTTKFTSTNALRIVTAGALSYRFFYYATNNSLVTGCGGNILSDEGELVNPPYEDRNHSYCTWNITVQPRISLEFTFTMFNMGSDTNCNLDNLQFYSILPDGSETLIKRLCGQDTPKDFQIHSNRVRIIAKKSPNFDGIGFHFSYAVAKNYDVIEESKAPNEFV